MRRLLTALTIVCLVAPAGARADSGATKLLIDACRDEHIDGTYTQAQYKKALEQIPSDSDEYSACRDVLERGRLAALGSKRKSNGGAGAGTTGGGGGGSTSPGTPARTADPLASATPAQRSALANAGQSAKPVEVGGKLVQPGALGMGALSGSGHSVPTPLAALIALLAASALAGGGWWLWSRVLARRFG
ncbi:MAG TPA: hypothetical protein VF257_16870 [Solirubrobacteraceae bacterium]